MGRLLYCIDECRERTIDSPQTALMRVHEFMRLSLLHNVPEKVCGTDKIVSYALSLLCVFHCCLQKLLESCQAQCVSAIEDRVNATY